MHPNPNPHAQGRFGETYGEQIAAAIEASLAPSTRAGGAAAAAAAPANGGAAGASTSATATAAPTPSASGPSWGLDLGKLCISAGKTAWALYVDALVLNDDGNVVGAVSAATLAALVDTRIPKVRVLGAGWLGRGGLFAPPFRATIWNGGEIIYPGPTYRSQWSRGVGVSGPWQTGGGQGSRPSKGGAGGLGCKHVGVAGL